MIENLDRDEIEAFLRRQPVGRVGCHVDGRTYVVPVIYAWDGECVYVQSIEGRKIDMMRASPRVCFEVDEYEPGGSWCSVILDGAYEELADNGATLALLVRRFGGTRSAREPRSARKPVAFRIRAQSLSGRRVTRTSPEQLATGFVRRLLGRGKRRRRRTSEEPVEGEGSMHSPLQQPEVKGG